MTQTIIHKSIEQINQAIDQIIDEVQDLNQEVILWKPSSEEWSIMQIVCHVAEAVPYWLTEIEMLLASPGNVWGGVYKIMTDLKLFQIQKPARLPRFLMN
ncbi:hypothetical protein [Bacillus sp. T3]|uniref:hypothetical protein n=1 Tax=Bacillus sp. T3 TaxID=467262 RepID=UPI00298136F6|nr:hypothetical protein [Bacillus sp. T3]